MFKSFNKFTSELHKEDPIYPSETKHRVNYVGSYGFEPWLDSMKDTVLTEIQLNSVVKTFMKFGGQKTADIPFLINSLERDHGIEIPAKEGIATREYWDKKFNSDVSLES